MFSVGTCWFSVFYTLFGESLFSSKKTHQNLTSILGKIEIIGQKTKRPAFAERRSFSTERW
jgi:hypothetical protein